MHVDVTPTVRLAGSNEKTGLIFHSKPEDSREPKLSLYANPHGFAQWFMQQTPPDQNFGAFFEKRSLDYDRDRSVLLAKRADAKPVPDQSPAYRKSRAVIALQLIKRWRNLAYDKRTPTGACRRQCCSPTTSRSTLTKQARSPMKSVIRWKACSPSCKRRRVGERKSPRSESDVPRGRAHGSLADRSFGSAHLYRRAENFRRQARPASRRYLARRDAANSGGAVRRKACASRS